MPRFESERAGATPRAVYAACATTFAIGLIFIFGRAPHPWGWEGFDHYHTLALALARGEPFPTMEVPWGYAYFLSGFYRVFGDRPWIPLTAQATLNALTPLALFHVAAGWLDRRTATVAAVICGVFSFNTVYASTQSSDAVCTVLFLASILAFARARRSDDTRFFALAGAIAGVAAQFRPNLVLIPAILAGYGWLERRSWRRVAQGAGLVACAIAALLPWIVRNYRLTHMLLPTSVHAGVQLWYGTLQTGDTLTSRARNPRSLFEAAAFDYTSLADLPVLVSSAFLTCDAEIPARASLRYWTDAEPGERTVEPERIDGRRFQFAIPATHRESVIYYYFDTRWKSPPEEALAPPQGRLRPFVYFVSSRHLEDLDVHGDLLDVFDLIRLLRRDAWGEAPVFEDRLKAAGVNSVRDAVARLAEPHVTREARDRLVDRIDHDDHRVTLTLTDGSTLGVPRVWSGRITDAAFTEGLSASLMTARRSLAALADRSPIDRCAPAAEEVRVNDVFYRQEPHMMRRYSALAWNNIGRDPIAFAVASVYRAFRLFVIAGTNDRNTAFQFTRSGLIYLAGTAASTVYLMLFAAGVVVAWRRGDDVWLPLVLILSIPATIAPVLTNMRYTITVQPLMFVFVAVALIAAVEAWRRPAPRAADPPATA